MTSAASARCGVDDKKNKKYATSATIIQPLYVKPACRTTRCSPGLHPIVEYLDILNRSAIVIVSRGYPQSPTEGFYRTVIGKHPLWLGTRPWRNKSDAELRADVRSELAEDPFVDADEIEVMVKDGNVLLKGTVENQPSLENAVENARDAGARKVISKLKTRAEE